MAQRNANISSSTRNAASSMYEQEVKGTEVRNFQLLENVYDGEEESKAQSGA